MSVPLAADGKGERYSRKIDLFHNTNQITTIRSKRLGFQETALFAIKPDWKPERYTHIFHRSESLPEHNMHSIGIYHGAALSTYPQKVCFIHNEAIYM